MNFPTIVCLVILVAIVSLIIWRMYVNKKKGKSACGCSCGSSCSSSCGSSCSSCSSCGGQENKQ